MASWKLIAESDTISNLSHSYQVKIYYWSDSSYTPFNIELAGDISLRRGNPNPKRKTQYFVNTQVDLAVIDHARTLYSFLVGKNSEDFRVDIIKNSSLYYSGSLSLSSDRIVYTDTTPIVSLTSYDGLSRLKRESDFTFTERYVKISDILNEILNSLKYDLDIIIYYNNECGELPDSSRGPHKWYADITQIVSNIGGITYYDILLELAKMFDWDIYQEAGHWVIRQSYGVESTYSIGTVNKAVIESTTGSVTHSTVTLNYANPHDKDDLGPAPVEYRYDRISRIEYKHSYPVSGAYSSNINWKNPYFKTDVGYTVVTGTPIFTGDALQLAPGGQVYQKSGLIDANSELEIEVAAQCVRMVLTLSEQLSEGDNPLLQIVYEGTNGSNYYLNNLNQLWDENPSYPETYKFGVPVPGVIRYDPATSSYVLVEEYNHVIKEFIFNIDAPATDGYIRINLFGGGAASGNNYPYELAAQFDRCDVRLRLDEGINAAATDSLITSINAQVEGDVVGESILWHDYAPQNDLCNHHAFQRTTYDPLEILRTFEWTISGGEVGHNPYSYTAPILEMTGEEVLRRNYYNTALDVKFLPFIQQPPAFTKIFRIDTDGSGVKDFIPIHQQSNLFADDHRFVLYQHERHHSLTIHKSFELRQSDS